MDNSSRYFEAAFIKPPVILGQRLLPFSVGHMKLLCGLKNKFVDGLGGISDLSTGVFVCCHEYYDAIEKLNDPATERLMAKWGRKCKNADLKEHSLAFRLYVSDSSFLPEFKNMSKGGRSPGSPVVLQVITVLLSKLGFSLRDALNIPWVEALWLFFGYMEIEGRAQLISPEDEEHLKKAKELIAEIQKENSDGV